MQPRQPLPCLEPFRCAQIRLRFILTPLSGSSSPVATGPEAAAPTWREATAVHGARFWASHSGSQGFNWLRRQLLKAPRVWEPGDGSADGCSAPGDILLGGGASASFCHLTSHPQRTGFPGGAVGKNPPANAGNARDTGSIPGSGGSPGGGKGSPLQYSCLENPTDRGAWWATVQGVPGSQTQLRMSSRACLNPKDTQWGNSAGALFLAVLRGGRTVESTARRSLTPTPGPPLRGWGGGHAPSLKETATSLHSWPGAAGGASAL